MNQFSLQGKTALLTGAAGFFGGYFADALLGAGASVVLIDHKRDRLIDRLGDLEDKFDGNRVFGYVVDQYNRGQTERIFQEISKGVGHEIDILINNAFDFSANTGFNTHNGRLEVSTYEQFRNCVDSGIYWAWQATQIFGYAMKKEGRGSIINICSMYGVVVPDPALYEETTVFNPPAYSMSKAGLLQFTRYAAAQLAPEIRVNAISPGAIPNNESPTNNPSDPQVSSRLLKKILLRRMGHPNDLTGALIFLASDASRYITGANIIVDGGLTIH